MPVITDTAQSPQTGATEAKGKKKMSKILFKIWLITFKALSISFFLNP
jgi:hypothetical protein